MKFNSSKNVKFGLCALILGISLFCFFNRGKVIKIDNQLSIIELKNGNGDEATNGKKLLIQYTGWISDTAGERKFDSSKDQGKPFSFILGEGQVIPGWDKGIVGMKTGGKRKLIVGPAYGYGSTGATHLIPPNSSLIYEIELIKVE